MVSLKETSYLLKVFQLIVAFSILLIEFVLAVGFRDFYYEEPTHVAHFFYWVTLTTQNLYLLHLTIRFRPQWQYGPVINRVISDSLILLTWLSICFVNISPVIRGIKLDCSEKSGLSLTRCQLFLTSFSLGWILIPTFIGSLVISIIKWRNDQLVSSTIPMSNVNNQNPPMVPKPSRPPSYTMQKGVLDGQPVLIFNDNNNKRMSFYNQRNSSTPHVRPLSYPNNSYNAGSNPNLTNEEQSERDTDSKSVNI